ncbi:hypothetical protein MES5069_360181 [Mesorhizobium escarrei]|uniref:Uncharacterized protein n=1 Tax=Mesorhizobium escarrei TaxID=666018 RepID=A0ABM9E239_9HYPH|nr:hypothetical protein MES5069_360181 [Mesorhizobium escarrei]
MNGVVKFVAPERNISMKLIHYEINSYPDAGAPQG